MSQKVLIIGGGNIGTDFACEFAAKGFEVNIYSSRPECFSDTLRIVDSEGRLYQEAKIAMATDDLASAMADCLYIFVILPAFMFGDIARRMEPFIKPGTFIGIIPGSGGAEFAFSECMKKGAVLFGLQRVPGISRLVEYGKTVCVEGRKKELFLASIPGTYSAQLAALTEDVFRIPCLTLPNYLNVTLTPSNPILHTTRLRSMFRDYREGYFYDRNPMFYEEWTLDSSELLLACDDELRAMIRKMDRLDLSMVKSLKDHYEVHNAAELTDKIRSIKSFRGLASPMKQVEQGWIPDFESRYFTADFSYGLAVLIELADVIGVPVPNMKDTMEWYTEVSGSRNHFSLDTYGIHTIDDIYRLYL